MQVLVSKKRGFCFGVTHATELAQKLLAQGKKVYCLGQLIHNKQVVDRLASQGLIVVEDLSQVPAVPAQQKTAGESPVVLIRSHGCHPQVLEEVRARGLELADATCILVKRAQKLAAELFAQGYRVVVIGDPQHPEVEGLVGYAPEVIVIADEADLAKLPPAGRLAIISQTTHSPEDFGRLVGLIAMRGFEEMKVINTICRETAHRQASAIELCGLVQVMFVLGSRTSANTRELANLCSRNDVETYHLQDWQEFKPQYVEGKSIAGVTAGASTPDWIIQEFVDNLEKLK